MTDPPERLGQYVVEREVGRGGMGVVYLARDTRLDRPVAIKVLPPEVASDGERLARFEREARLLASLNHPNIAAIHGLEEDGEHRFLVLEYVDGPTLADRLAGGALAPDEAVEVCAQIAAALEAAHESGVIHRDLKPANVKITPTGEVKVLDFGLAKGAAGIPDSAPDLTQSPTLTRHATGVGIILGTAAYMSPEQARGKPVDRRTDIFSFGCVLYECLAGLRLFDGETASDTIAKVLEREPDWSEVPESTPEPVQEILRRCLEKDARRRQRDIGDVRLRLQEVIESGRSGIRPGPVDERPAAPPARSRLAAILPWAVAALAVAIAGAGMLAGRGEDGGSDAETIRFQVHPPSGVVMVPASFQIQISPDGRSLLWRGRDDSGSASLWVRPLDALESRSVPGTTNTSSGFWSPDSRSIAFFAGDKLRRVSVDGGATMVVCDAPSDRGGSWGREYIVFAGDQGPIYKTPASGGEPVPATRLDASRGETAHRFPVFLPDGETFLYVALPSDSRRLTVFATDVHGREPVEVLTALGTPVYAEPGYLVYQRDNRILAVRFDPASLTVSGDPVLVGTAPPLPPAVGAPVGSASRTGHLAHLAARKEALRLAWMNGDGNVTEILDIEPDQYLYPRVSPDGRHVALVREVSPEESDVWVLELERTILNRFTFGPGIHADPIWSPDGTRIAYSTEEEGRWNIYTKPFPGGGDPEPLVVGEALFKNPLDWSRDGTVFLWEQLGPGTNMDLWVVPADGSDPPRPYLAGTYQEAQGRFSPDGRWVVYSSFEAGDTGIYVNSFPEPGRKLRVASDPGFNPFWWPDGRAVGFFSRRRLIRVPITLGPVPRAGTPETLFEVDGSSRFVIPDTDNDRFFILLPASDERVGAAVILNWAPGS